MSQPHDTKGLKAMSHCEICIKLNYSYVGSFKLVNSFTELRKNISLLVLITREKEESAIINFRPILHFPLLKFTHLPEYFW